MRKLAIVNVAALSPREVTLENTPNFWNLAQKGSMNALEAPEPALTCPSHATMITGLPPVEHGVIGNGWYDREQAKVLNWGRSDNLVAGEKIWEALSRRSPKSRTANLFWRYCTHAKCALTMTERPTYFSNGRKGADVYASDYKFKQLCIDRLGAFPFFHFWPAGRRLEALFSALPFQCSAFSAACFALAPARNGRPLDSFPPW